MNKQVVWFYFFFKFHKRSGYGGDRFILPHSSCFIIRRWYQTLFDVTYRVMSPRYIAWKLRCKLFWLPCSSCFIIRRWYHSRFNVTYHVIITALYCMEAAALIVLITINTWIMERLWCLCLPVLLLHLQSLRPVVINRDSWFHLMVWTCSEKADYCCSCHFAAASCVIR